MESSGAPGPADQSNVLHAISSLGLADLITTRDAMWDEYETNVHGYPMDNIVELDERILTLCSVGHPDRVDACERLSTSLRKSSPSTSSLTVSDTDGDDSSHEHLDVLRMTRDALLVEYQETTDMDTLDQTIDLGEQVLALCTSKNLDRAAACSDLAHSLRLRSQQKTRADGVETTIDHTLEPIATLPPDVIMLLWQSYEESGDPELFKQVIDAKTVVLNSFPEQDPRRVRACTDLADTLFQQYPLTGDDAVLNQVISLYSEARALCPSEHDDRVIICVQLAIHQYQLHKHTGDVNPLNEAIALEREALALCPLGHRNRVALCDNLASSLYLLYHRTGDVDSLIEAMKLEREVLASRSAGHPDRASACVSLAASLDERYGQTGDGAMLNEAIELLREALGLCRSGDQSLRASSCSSLARCLKGRYEQTGDISLLDEAIDLGREAVSLRPSGHPDRSPPCSDLAFSLKAKYERAGDVDLLIEAIELEREILVLHPPGDPTRAGSCGNLAYSHKRLYEHTGAEYLIIEATKLEREALALHPRGHLNYAASCDSLADILRTHYERTGDTSLCNEAIQLSLTGSECAPRPVAWRSLALLSLLYLSQRTRSESALPTALKYLQELSHCEPGDIRFYMSSVHMLLGRFWACHADWTPEVSSAVASVYPDIIDKLPLMATFVLNTSSRLLALRSFSQLGSQACVVSLQAGRLPQAVELLDQAHGIIWAQALRQRDPQLSDVPPELASDLAMLLRAMTVPASSSTAERHLTLQDVRHENNSRIKELQSEIRRIQGLERFMRGSTFETLRQVARDHPVVVLVGVDTESYGVIISDAAQEEPQLVKLSITSRRILQLRGYTQRAGARQRAAAEDGWRDAWTEPVESPGGLQDLGRYMRPRDQSHSLSGVLKELWEGIVKPVLALLGLKRAEGDERPRLHWCATGHFASLPLHAAGIYGGASKECSSDYVVASYTPTLSSLLRAQAERPPALVRDSDLVLISASPTSSGHFKALPEVGPEIDLVAGLALSVDACPNPLSPDDVTSEQMARALQSASIVHIACHGLQNAADPLESAFHLSGERTLSVSELMELDLKRAELAFLSACETAKGDREQPDQAIHLAATMLFVGFRSVIGTMWAMNDEDGPAVAEAFYGKLFESEVISTDAIPRALDHATKMLREKKVPPERWATFMHAGA